MKSVPEILLKKPVNQWTPADGFVVRVGVGAAGMALWLLIIFFVKILQPYSLIPWKPVYFAGIFYAAVLFFLSYKVFPSDLIKTPAAVEKRADAAPLAASSSGPLEGKTSGFRSKLKRFSSIFKNFTKRKKPASSSRL